MSNIAGKAYAMNVVTPVKWWWVVINKIIFWIAVKFPSKLAGLTTLSLIHYARWVIVKPNQFPRLSDSQPKEDLKYAYMFFFSNFNGSWAQYVDSFSSAIPSGLDLFWFKNVRYPHSVPMRPFHDYISFNQTWTNHYFNSYPMASSNDVKAAKRVKAGLLSFIDDSENFSDENTFESNYNKLLLSLHHDLSRMSPSPIVSLAAGDVDKRRGNSTA